MVQGSKVDTHVKEIALLNQRLLSLENGEGGGSGTGNTDVTADDPTTKTDTGDQSASQGGNPIDLKYATILEQSPPLGNRGGDAMLDNYLDPYNWDWVWMTEGVAAPYTTIDAGRGITVSNVVFYKRNNDTVNDTGNGKRFPENFEVLSAPASTGPWTSRGTAVYSPYPAPLNTNMHVDVIFPSATSARYWRVIVSRHQWLNSQGKTISEINQAVFISG